MFKQAENFYNKGEFQRALECLIPQLHTNTATLEELQLAGECSALIGDIGNAERIFKKCIDYAPKDTCGYYNLGVFYSHCGRADEAFEHYSQCYTLNPSYLPAAEALSRMMRNAGWFKQAESVARTILQHHPNKVSAYSELGSILVATGDVTAGIEIYKKGIVISPQNLHIRSQMLLAMNYSSNYNQNEIYNQSIKWAEQVQLTQVDTSTDTKRAKIRIGYISGDFKRHSVAYFIEPILFNHDKDIFEIFCYSYTDSLDEVTERIVDMCDHWRDMVRIPTDVECAQLIANDSLDILIDLGGHTYDGIKALSYKPAPIQMTYLGYPNTTGLTAIDYRITDNIADPNSDNAKHYSESLYRLHSGFLAFSPPLGCPNVQPTPCIEKGYITFASFNNYAKVTEECIDMWCKILQRVDNSRLIIKSKLFNEQGFKDDIYKKFNSRGISSERLDLKGHIKSLNGHLDLYNDVDIALDTFPYNGTTTTCEALWMGVPVISMYGDDHRSRVGLSILTQIGLSSLAASSSREYMKQAIKLANNYENLNALRSSLRKALAISSVCDAITTTRELEEAYKSCIEMTSKN